MCLQMKQAGNCVYMLKAVDRKNVATANLIRRSFVFGVLFNDAIASWLYTATMIDERMTEDQWWRDINSEHPCTWSKPSTTLTSSIAYHSISQTPGRERFHLELIVNLHVSYIFQRATPWT